MKIIIQMTCGVCQSTNYETKRKVDIGFVPIKFSARNSKCGRGDGGITSIIIPRFLLMGSRCVPSVVTRFMVPGVEAIKLSLAFSSAIRIEILINCRGFYIN